jgi:hypothetical protein
MTTVGAIATGDKATGPCSEIPGVGESISWLLLESLALRGNQQLSSPNSATSIGVTSRL